NSSLLLILFLFFQKKSRQELFLFLPFTSAANPFAFYPGQVPLSFIEYLLCRIDLRLALPTFVG
ncbi:MAG: hypothetical protein K2I54_02590, partial [Muribaculaceae bacterium]|nr:hypothetical protein [Muribaculaceae bacterium]